MTKNELYIKYGSILQSQSTIEHIFVGEINNSNNAVGFHHEGEWAVIGNSSIIEWTKTDLDSQGVYEADVIIKEKHKDGFSSFFPIEFTPEDVLECIHEAYQNRKQKTRSGLYQGETKDGLEINFYLNNSEKIKTAFPVYNYL